MNWFYAENDAQAGPVDDAEFVRLQGLGRIDDRTLVYCQGMADWMSLAEARKQGFLESLPKLAERPAERAAVVPEAGPAGEARVNPLAGAGLKPKVAAEGAGSVACPSCGARVGEDELIPLGERFVCVRCRDVTLQKIREGVNPTGLNIRYAGFGTRFLGSFVDGIIMNIYSTILNAAFGLGFAESASPELGTATLIVYFGLSIAVPLAYVVYFMGNPRFQATPGMMAVKIRLYRPGGVRVTYWRAFGRYLASIISSLLLGIGYLMMLWDAENRTLHDRMADTRVVHK